MTSKRCLTAVFVAGFLVGVLALLTLTLSHAAHHRHQRRTTNHARD